MDDRVADILEQRAHLESGAGSAVALSILLHAALMGTAVYAALHQPPPEPVSMVNIRLAQAAMPAAAPPRAKPTPAPEIPAPAPVPVETPKIQEPKPAVEKVAEKKPEKNTVPLSPFGRSTKKGAETPEAPPIPAPPAAGAPGVGSAADVPVGGSGITGLEGGDFPYTIYLEGMQRKIGGNWYRPQVQGGISAVVYFRIQRDGTLTDAKVLTPSGNGTFDRQALSAVRSSSPLNPLPFGYNGTYLGVHLTFR